MIARKPTSTTRVGLPLASDAPLVVADSRRRLRLLLFSFWIVLVAIFARMVSLERSDGEAFRQLASKPLVRREIVSGTRGRILARDGSVLAEDRRLAALALLYRHFQEPPDPAWLRARALKRLSPKERRDPDIVAATVESLRQELVERQQSLASLCGVTYEVWRDRCALVQRRVERIAASVARRRGTTKPVVVAEELTHHVICDCVDLDALAEIEKHPDLYPAVKITLAPQRHYPQSALAANVLGYLGEPTADELQSARAAQSADEDNDNGQRNRLGDSLESAHLSEVGRLGIERQYDAQLQGRPGLIEQRVQRDGRLLGRHIVREATTGQDVVLSIDPRLQRTAEELLDQTVATLADSFELNEPPGDDADSADSPKESTTRPAGAALVMDIRSGEILAAASTPRFDPNIFARGDQQAIVATLADEQRPLFDRSLRMAVPPGSVFKIVSAIAMLESGLVSPGDVFHCQGYLHRPDQQRCLIFTRTGHGHGDLNLTEALMCSCNVFFFDAATRLGPVPLVDWSMRLGLGQPTGVDVPDEPSGTLPTPRAMPELTGEVWHTGHTQALAVGQTALRVTPLQMATVMAAIAGDGRIVRPHFARQVGAIKNSDGDADSSSTGSTSSDNHAASTRGRLVGISPETLSDVRGALERVVSDPRGTAHASLFRAVNASAGLAIAGKTGTAETGPRTRSHAWFAGYAPADAPRMVVVVVIEHGGEGSRVAAPVAGRLFTRLDELDYLRRRGHLISALSDDATRTR